MESYGPAILRTIVGMIIAALLCLALTGPGAFSIEHRRARFAEADAAGRGRLRGTL